MNAAAMRDPFNRRRVISANEWRCPPLPVETPESELNLSEGLRRSLPVLYAETGAKRRHSARDVVAGVITLVGLLWVVIAVAIL